VYKAIAKEGELKHARATEEQKQEMQDWQQNVY